MGWTRRVLLGAGIALSIGLSGQIAGASDPPDSAANRASGFIETVDSVWAGSSYEIRHVIDRGPGQPPFTAAVTEDAADDLAPRITVGPGGNTWVVWWRDAATDEVFLRELAYSPRTWGPAERISNAGESSRNPEIAHDGTTPWVAYEFDTTEGTGIGAVRIDESPEPFPFVIATTAFTGDVDTMIHAESGHLWVTWVDSDTEVGWSEYDYGAEAWSSPRYESYGSDDVSAARDRISATALGN